MSAEIALGLIVLAVGFLVGSYLAKLQKKTRNERLRAAQVQNRIEEEAKLRARVVETLTMRLDHQMYQLSYNFVGRNIIAVANRLLGEIYEEWAEENAHLFNRIEGVPRATGKRNGILVYTLPSQLAFYDRRKKK